MIDILIRLNRIKMRPGDRKIMFPAAFSMRFPHNIP